MFGVRGDDRGSVVKVCVSNGQILYPNTGYTQAVCG